MNSTVKNVVDSLTESKICLIFGRLSRNILYLKHSYHCYESTSKFFKTERNYKLIADNHDKQTTQFLGPLSHKRCRNSQIVR